METKRINTGIYQVRKGDRLFEVEAYGKADWLLFEMIEGNREYMRDFWTKRDALECIKGI